MAIRMSRRFSRTNRIFWTFSRERARARGSRLMSGVYSVHCCTGSSMGHMMVWFVDFAVVMAFVEPLAGPCGFCSLAGTAESGTVQSDSSQTNEAGGQV